MVRLPSAIFGALSVATMYQSDNEGSLTLATRFDLAIKAFEHTAAYDSMIANYFGSMVPAYHGYSGRS